MVAYVCWSVGDWKSLDIYAACDLATLYLLYMPLPVCVVFLTQHNIYYAIPAYRGWMRKCCKHMKSHITREIL